MSTLHARTESAETRAVPVAVPARRCGAENPLRYATEGSTAFQARLHGALCKLTGEVEEALGSNYVALLLGGGYGRGEGAVVERDGTEYAYNDLDLTLVVRDKRQVPHAALEAISRRYEAELHVHVDFSRPLTPGDIEHWPHWMMWHDLLYGHVVLSGPEDVLTSRAPDSVRRQLPLIEGTRLLLNRGTGLMWAQRVLRGVEAEPDADFVRRNYYKCALAIGDAVLIAYGAYATPYHGRDRRLMNVLNEHPDIEKLGFAPLYGEALGFKFRPDRVTGRRLDEAALDELARTWGTVFLLVENLRTGRAFRGLREYAAWPGVREPEEHRPARLPRNFARNLQHGRLSWRYPRERLYRELPGLLGLTPNSPSDWAAASARFLAVWDRFN